MVSVSVIMAVSKDNYSESLKSALNQTLADIEVICIDDNDIVNVTDSAVKVIKKDDSIDEVKGEYIYFLNPGDVLNKDTLEKAFRQAKGEGLDFIQITDEDTFIGETYQFLKLRGKTFQMDMTRYTKLIRTDFIKKLNNINSNDYLFFWECVFNARKFAFINLNQKFNKDKKDFDELAGLINVSNEVFTKFKDYDHIGKFKFIIFDWRLELLYDAYVNVTEERKEEYYNLLKEDFTQMIYHWRFTDFAYDANPINYLFFKDVVYSKDFDDFKRLMVQYELELDSEEVKKENEIIEKNISILERENSLITNSTSWKVTKPLRKLNK